MERGELLEGRDDGCEPSRRRIGPAERMQPAVMVPVLEQGLIEDRVQRAVQGGEHRQLVVRPLDRHERVAERFDLLALVIGAPADEQMANAPRLELVHVGPRDVAGPEIVEAPEQQAHVAGLDRDALAGPLALGHGPAAVA